MKIFISWSGDRSKKVAELLQHWVKCVIQAVEPWVSTNGIDRGALWFSAISSELANTSVGIVCLTKENKDKPWILFESGALAKGLDSNLVCTFLIDLIPSDLSSPLSHFNHTQATRGGLYALIRTINFNLGENSLGDKILESVFETYWPQFESSFKQIMDETPESTVVEQRSESDIMLEILSSVRNFDRRITNIEKGVINSVRANKSDSDQKSKFKWNVIDNFNKQLSDVQNLANQKIEDLMAQGYLREHAQREVYEKYFGGEGNIGIWNTDGK